MKLLRMLILSSCLSLTCHAQNYRRILNTTGRAFLKTDMGKNVERLVKSELKEIQEELPEIDLPPEVVAISSATYYTLSKKKVELSRLMPTKIVTEGVDISPNLVYSWKSGHEYRANIRFRFKIKGFTH